MRHEYRRAFVLLCAFCALLGAAAPARAHDLALSSIRILSRPHDVVVIVTTPISRLLRAEGQGAGAMSAAALDLAIRRRLHLRMDGQALSPRQATVIGDSAADLVSWQTTVTGTFKSCEVMARLYPEDPASRTVVLQMRDGQVFQEALLDSSNPTLLLGEPPLTPSAVALRYVLEGVGHIYGGPDHILFVLGLLLLGGTLRSLLRTVTAFTLAHSVTLTLAATGVLHPSPRIVEPLIALSIVAIAVENLRPRPAASVPPCDLRPCYAFGFGLVHGFGFAGALAEIGLPREALGVALASFNIGVEIGQVTIILLAWPLLTWLGNVKPVILQRTVGAGSYTIGIAGAYWFFSRLLPF